MLRAPTFSSNCPCYPASAGFFMPAEKRRKASMIQYPAGLPCFERTGYGLKTVDPQLRSELDSGRSRVRRKFTATPTEVQCSVLMRNDSQAQLFEAWWEQVLFSGTKYFEAPLKAPLGTETYTAKFIGIYDG